MWLVGVVRASNWGNAFQFQKRSERCPLVSPPLWWTEHLPLVLVQGLVTADTLALIK